MSKKRKSTKRDSGWGVPNNAIAYFDRRYDNDFKAKRPVLYWLTVVAIIICVMVGPTLYTLLCSIIQSTVGSFEIIFWLFGLFSSLGISIGICNLLMILHKQYLGHYVTLFSFAIGIVGSAIGLFFLWLI